MRFEYVAFRKGEPCQDRKVAALSPISCLRSVNEAFGPFKPGGAGSSPAGGTMPGDLVIRCLSYGR